MRLFEKNPFGHYLIIKKMLIRYIGYLTHRRYRGFNELKIEGSNVLNGLPDSNVLFVSNHQTYFADVVAMLHVFNASLHGRNDTIKNVGYLWNPKLNIYYVAAKETMRSGLLPRILSYAGSYHSKDMERRGQDVKRDVNKSDINNISLALKDGWVITFPQGTTTPFRPLRKGTAHLIKQFKPLVVPIVIDGFRRSFDKKGILIKKKGVIQSMCIKNPLDIDYEKESADEIIHKIEFAIEQHPSFLRVHPINDNIN